MSTSMSTERYLCRSTAVAIVTSTSPCYAPDHMIHSREPRHWHQQLFWSLFWTLFDSWFSIWLESVVVLSWLYSIFINSIWLASNVLILTWVTQVKSHSSQAAGSPTLARLSSKYPNTEIVKYFTILIIKMGSGEEHSNRILKRLLRSKHQDIFRI